jgi:hypothetical protein
VSYPPDDPVSNEPKDDNIPPAASSRPELSDPEVRSHSGHLPFTRLRECREHHVCEVAIKTPNEEGRHNRKTHTPL